MKKTQKYYRKKGTYNDGRMRIVIEWQEGAKKFSKSLPKPETLLKILDGLKIEEITEEKLDG